MAARREYSFISEEKRRLIVEAYNTKEESVKARAQKLGVKYITAKQIVQRWKRTGKFMTKGWKKESAEEKSRRIHNENQKAQEKMIQNFSQAYGQVSGTIAGPIMAPVLVNPQFIPPPNQNPLDPAGFGYTPMVQFPAQAPIGFPQLSPQVPIPYPVVPMVYPQYAYVPTLNTVSETLNNQTACPPQVEEASKGQLNH